MTVGFSGSSGWRGVAAADAGSGCGAIGSAGGVAVACAVPVCVALIGPARAKRMIMSGKLFDAATLLGWGFLDEVVPREKLDAAARAMAEEYAALPPIAVQMIKRSINRVAGALDQAVMHADSDQWLLAAHSGDFREAVGAFFEKRKPSFKGN